MNSVKWGEFRLGDLFEIVGTKSIDSNAVDFVDNGINFVGRTFENNGIQGYINRRSFDPNAPFTITATVIGNYKYVKFQKQPYYCSQNINRLTPKNIISRWNEYIAYYFVTIVQQFVSIYDGQQGGYKLDDINNFTLNLPIIQSGNIDYDSIEALMRELEDERIRELSAYLKASGLDDTNLTIEEHNALRMLNLMSWSEYNVPNVFEVKNTRNIDSSSITENSGTTPYLCASAFNNGVSSYILYDESMMDKGNCIFIGGKTFVVSYQEKDFFSNDSHNLALYCKDIPRTKLNQLFLVTCVNKSLGHKYTWGDSISKTKIKNDKILLPSTDGHLDYSMMETVIRAVQKILIKDVVKYVNKKLEYHSGK